MKVVIERTQTGIAVQIEGGPDDTPEDVAHAFVTVDEIVKGDGE